MGIGRNTHRLVWANVLLAWVASLLALPWAPARVPSHWNAAGQIDQTLPRLPGLFLLPLVITLLAGMFLLLPRIDPLRRNYAAFSPAYALLRLGMILFLSLLHLAILAIMIGWSFNLVRLITVLYGVLFIVVGNVLGKLRPNWFVGIRTPWTLMSPDVWTATHRVVGRLQVVLGLIVLFAGLALPQRTYLPAILSSVVSLSAVAFGYSYWAWRSEAIGGRGDGR